MTRRFRLPIVVALGLLGSQAIEAQELFRLVVDPAAPTPLADATGRHALSIGGVADVDPGAPTTPGSVVATNEIAPDGSKAALFTGGWLEITSDTPALADDLVFPGDRRRTLSLWFKSPGNGEYSSGLGYFDRMHAVGFGTDANNLEVDFGDTDQGGHYPDGVPSETACWTYWDGAGGNRVVAGNSYTEPHDRNYYLDDEWHHYELERAAGLVSVSIDGVHLGTTPYATPLGSSALDAHDFIGRSNWTPGAGIDPFPWFGLIAGFAVVDTPDTTPPVLACPPLLFAPVPKSGSAGRVVTFSVAAVDETDPSPTVICVPPPGSFFPRGATIVTCTATDAAGNQSTCTFPVVVTPSYRRL